MENRREPVEKNRQKHKKIEIENRKNRENRENRRVLENTGIGEN